MRYRSDYWRFSLFAALGLCPNACGGRTEDNSSAVAEIEGQTRETESSTDPTTRPSSPSSTSPGQHPATTAATPPTSPGETITGSPSSTVSHPEPVTTGSIDGGAATVLPSIDGGQATGSEPPVDAGRPSACGDSTPYAQNQIETGLFQCDNGLRHRPSTDVECPSTLPRDVVFDVEGNYPGECTSDSDCTDEPFGFCSYSDGQLPEMVCKYGCLTDADCAADELCVCGDPVGQCVASNCRADSDCSEGMLCAYWGETTGIGCPVTPHYVCQTPDDECAVDADCPQTDFGMRCSAAGGVRKCVEVEGVACGRPFLVAGAGRLAELARAKHETRVQLGAPLDADARATLGEHWAAAGLMEHASIAAFARFTLQLMHVGAPRSLLMAAQQAMLDETAHADICFEIASELFGYSVEPGKLPMDMALDETNLSDIVRLTFREGCLGETIAAMEAAEAAALATESKIVRALQKIEADELRHAELAWRFVQWALKHDSERGGSSLRSVVAEEVEYARRTCETAVGRAPTDNKQLEAFGVLSHEQRRRIRQEAVVSVVVPCAMELLRVAAAKEGTMVLRVDALC